MPVNNVFNDTLRLAIRQAMLTWAEKTRNDAIELAPLGKPNKDLVPGQLKAGIRVDPLIENGSSFTISVSSNAPHAGYVEFGTDPHRIAPKTPDGRLVFFWDREGRMFFGGKGQAIENHPGGKEKPYLNPAAEKNKPEFVQNLSAAFGRAIVESIDYAFKKAQK